MRLEGTIKDRELLYGVFTDGALYAITAPEWALRVQ
jgi:RimJ/RimL family protein N-acetyltransferase